MKTITIARTIAGSLALIVLSLAQNVGAAMGNRTCEWGELCLWHDINYSGPIIEFVSDVGSFPGYHYDASSANVNDSVSSLFNGTAGYVRLTVDSNGHGEGLCVGPGISVANLKNVAWPVDGWNDVPVLYPNFNDSFSAAYFNVRNMNVFNCDVIFFQYGGHLYEDVTQYKVWPYIAQFTAYRLN